MEETTGEDSVCYGPGSIAGAVIGTFLTTALILALAVVFYRQWRRHKGKLPGIEMTRFGVNWTFLSFSTILIIESVFYREFLTNASIY